MCMQQIITTMKLNFPNVLQKINLDLFDLREPARLKFFLLVSDLVRRQKNASCCPFLFESVMLSIIDQLNFFKEAT